MGAVLTAMLLLAGCTGGEGNIDDINDDDENVPTVKAKFVFSFKPHIAGKRKAKNQTRMTGDVVQESGAIDEFRGYDDVHLLCFNTYPTAESKKIGKMIEMYSGDPNMVDSVTEKDLSEFREIDIPVGTSHFGFYARAADAPATHEERMMYGVIERVGLDKNTYKGNSGIRFRPVPICTSTEPLGGSAIGQRLLNLLNDLMNITGPEAAPNNKWATVNNLYLNEAYQRMKELKVLSSQHVQIMLAAVNRIIHQEGPDNQGVQLADAITAKIASVCTTPPEPDSETIELIEDYQGYPEDIHVPTGAARIQWDEAQGRYIEPDVQAYGKELNVMSVNDYVYPMNLQYQVLSNILASDKVLVLPTEDDGIEPTGDEPEPADSTGNSNTLAESWQNLVDSLYDGGSTVVQQSTQSVAMVQQVNYAVGRLALHTRISSDAMYDAKGKSVNVSNGFTLKGYIVGGQREVDYNFQPVAGSHEYAIYDNYLGGAPQHVVRRDYTDFTHILGLGTASDKNIYLALELVNDGPDFQGADGLIMHGATFYLVADLSPAEGTHYTPGSLDQIFSRDRYTKVNLTINGGWRDKNGDGIPDPDLDKEGNPLPITGLATATYGLPNLDIPHPTVGVSVDLAWGEGLWFDDIVL